MHSTSPIFRPILALFVLILCLPATGAAEDDDKQQPSKGDKLLPDAQSPPAGKPRIEIDLERKPGKSGSVKVRTQKSDGTDSTANKTDKKKTGKEKEVELYFKLGTGKKIQLRRGSNQLRLRFIGEGRVRKVETPKENYIGVFTQPLSPALAAQLSGLLSGGQGLLVTGVMPGSPAEKAGIKKHDVLAKYDDQKLFNTPQLQQLILGEKPGRTLKLSIVRQAESQSIEVTAAQRPVVPILKPVLPGVVPHPGLFRPLFIFKGKPDIIGPEKKRSPAEGGGEAVKPSVKIPGKRAKGNEPSVIRQRSVVITTQDGKQYRIRAAITDGKGKTNSVELTGTLEEIRKQLGQLTPAELREDVRGSLDRLGTDKIKGKGRSFRFQLQPGIEGLRRLYLRLQQPGEKNATRVLELDLSSDREIKADDLLEIEVLAEELKQLPREVRSKVESTLRQTKFPAVRIKVERSQ